MPNFGHVFGTSLSTIDNAVSVSASTRSDGSNHDAGDPASGPQAQTVVNFITISGTSPDVDIYLEESPDNSNWSNGMLIDSISEAVTDHQLLYVPQARYGRLSYDNKNVSNSATVTRETFNNHGNYAT